MLIQLLSSVFAFTAIILFVVTFVLVSRKKKKLANSKVCSGTIIDIKEEYRMNKRNIWPIISYVVDGTEHVFNGRYFSTSMKVGDRVDIVYDVIDHSKASVKTGLSVAPMITGILATVFTIANAICVVLMMLRIV